MARQPLVAGLTAAQENRDLLLDTDRREILRFRLIRRTEIGQNRKDGGSSPGFIESTADAINSFDGSVIERPSSDSLVEAPIADGVRRVAPAD